MRSLLRILWAVGGALAGFGFPESLEWFDGRKGRRERREAARAAELEALGARRRAEQHERERRERIAFLEWHARQEETDREWKAARKAEDRPHA